VNTLDVAVLGLIFLLGVRGWFRGFFRELFGLAAWLGGGVGAHVLGPTFAPFASEHTGLPIALGQVIAFLGVFLAIYVVCRILGFLLARAAYALFLRPLDRTAGLVLGATKGLAIGALLCMIVTSRRGMPTMTEQVKESPLLSTLVERSWELVGEVRQSLGLSATWDPLPYSKLEESARKALLRQGGGSDVQKAPGATKAVESPRRPGEGKE